MNKARAHNFSYPALVRWFYSLQCLKVVPHDAIVRQRWVSGYAERFDGKYNLTIKETSEIWCEWKKLSIIRNSTLTYCCWQTSRKI